MRQALSLLICGRFAECAGKIALMSTSREDFLGIFPQESVGAELGVFKGEFTKDILQRVKPRELHLVDVWWTLFGDTYPDWGEYTNYGKLKTRDAMKMAEQVVAESKWQPKVCFHVGNDVEYLETFPDAYFDWLYIDSSHEYEHTLQELDVANRKTKPNGIIAGDDWNDHIDHVHYGVVKAVKEFLAGSNCRLDLFEDRTGRIQWALRKQS
jgi:SAM-dependent methyltransferase